MAEKSIAELVEGAAIVRGNPSVPRGYIEEALHRIDAEKEEVLRYPTGAPSLKSIYEIAARLESESAIKN